MNKKHKKWGHPLSLLVIGDGNPIYNDSKFLTSTTLEKDPNPDPNPDPVSLYSEIAYM